MQAVPYLFRALATHTQLTHIKLTNISFPEIGVDATNGSKVTLVDVYESSIWGPRLRMPRIIGAAQTLLAMEQELSQSETREEEMQQRLDAIHEAIMNLVTVVVETERIEGGDRGY
ncbi:hypothetical protein MPER_04303 [Moniliophthora perniciosa FA553]|nr:hypothetical protein MPER_04303 [Moniliophthora perniciosa FA553]